MIARCHNPEDDQYYLYGGRGISVCQRWRDSYKNLVADMGMPAQGMTLERIDNNGNYEPENVRWATRAEQARNTRRNQNITFDGRTQILADWARETGLSKRTIHARIYRYGWNIQDALTRPALTAKEKTDLAHSVQSIQCVSGHAYREGTYKIDVYGHKKCFQCLQAKSVRAYNKLKERKAITNV